MIQRAAFPENTERLRSGVTEFAERLNAGLGGELTAVVLFGSAVRGNFNPGTSDANVMLVLRSVSVPILDQIATAAEPLRREFALSLLTVTEEDLGDSAELFPTKFLDIQRNNEVIFGRDVMTSLAVPLDRLRRQARRQLMNLHLRLRQVYLESRARPEQLAAMIQRSVITLTLNLGLLLELRTGKPCEDADALLAGAQEAGVYRGELQKFIEFKHARTAIPPAELRRFYELFMELVAAAIRMADAT